MQHRVYRFMGIALISFSMFGCASKLVDAENEKVLDYSMTNSKKLEIVNSATSKTFVTVTYLNPLTHEDVNQESEKFIVGTYLATGDGPTLPMMLQNFKINGQKALSVTPLEQGDLLLKLVPSSNGWTKYVLVEAPKTETIKMEISFENDRSQRVSATFQKDF